MGNLAMGPVPRWDRKNLREKEGPWSSEAGHGAVASRSIEKTHNTALGAVITSKARIEPRLGAVCRRRRRAADCLYSR